MATRVDAEQAIVEAILMTANAVKTSVANVDTRASALLSLSQALQTLGPESK